MNQHPARTDDFCCLNHAQHSVLQQRRSQTFAVLASVNSKAAKLALYRIGDRNLLETVVGRDFQRNLDRYDLNRLTELHR